MSNAFVNLLNGSPPSAINGTPTYSIGGIIGPYSAYTSTASHDFSGRSTDDDNSLTVAAILAINTLGTAADIFYMTDSALTGGIAFYASTTGELKSDCPGPWQTASSGITLAVNIPYFVLLTLPIGSSAGWVVKRLDTGEVNFAITAVAGFNPSAPNGTHRVGNSNGTQPSRSRIAAVMMSGQALSLPQALMWADDPWSFWYDTAGL